MMMVMMISEVDLEAEDTDGAAWDAVEVCISHRVRAEFGSI